ARAGAPLQWSHALRIAGLSNSDLSFPAKAGNPVTTTRAFQPISCGLLDRPLPAFARTSFADDDTGETMGYAVGIINSRQLSQLNGDLLVAGPGCPARSQGRPCPPLRAWPLCGRPPGVERHAACPRDPLAPRARENPSDRCG